MILPILGKVGDVLHGFPAQKHFILCKLRPAWHLSRAKRNTEHHVYIVHVVADACRWFFRNIRTVLIIVREMRLIRAIIYINITACFCIAWKKKNLNSTRRQLVHRRGTLVVILVH